MNEIILEGCVPDPLYSNLKALGIFRILAQQEDKDIRACWQNNHFVLSTKMTQDDLVNFFLDKYSPTPIVSPWNNGSGFYDVLPEFINKIRNSKLSRLEQYRNVLERVEETLGNIIPEYKDFTSKRDKESSIEIKDIKDNVKPYLLSQLRNHLPEVVLPWMDAAYRAGLKKPTFGRILGTGGNDGNFEFSKNFMTCVKECILDAHADEQKNLIMHSLFNTNTNLTSKSFGYFHPGGYISPATGGKSEVSLVNPWDYMLTIEGTMLFAGNISRRSNSISKYVVFPFTMESTKAGYSTYGEENDRGEIWMPLWNQPATYREIEYVFREGRSKVGMKESISGVDFARAAVTLGTERGISEFQRFGIFERKGLAYFAIGVGRIRTKERQEANVLSDLDNWITKILKNKSNTMESLLNQLDNSIIRFCEYGQRENMQEILINVGKIESHIPERLKDAHLNSLSPEWILACDDHTPEFRLAVSLASIGYDTNYPIRENLEQIEITNNKTFGPIASFKKQSPSTVWGTGSLIHNMIAILERRIIDAQIKKSKFSLNSMFTAPIKDIIQFIEGNVDYQKISDLLIPLSMVNYQKIDTKPDWCNDRKIYDVSPFVPEIYACIKPIFPPVTIDKKEMFFEPSIIRLLKSRKSDMAITAARQRLKVTGHNVSTYSSGQKNIISNMSDEYTDRVMASILFPLDYDSTRKIINRVCLYVD